MGLVKCVAILHKKRLLFKLRRQSSSQFTDTNRAAQSQSEYRKCFLICK